MTMPRAFIVFIIVLSIAVPARARVISATPATYRGFLAGLAPGDTLALAAGTYTEDLVLRDLAGTPEAPIVITGTPDGTAAIFRARACCNTVSITRCAYVIVRCLWLDGDGVAVDAVKGEGTTGNWAHHITLEQLTITGYGSDQQNCGISTKCHAWDWTIRRSRIIGAGTGLYLGNSDGDKPFVRGVIEYNAVLDPVGYCMQIKHQSIGVRDAFAGTAADGRTIIRHNVFSKQQGASTGANARPNVLLGAFPATGAGANDLYEVYGNVFHQNPVEALLQATGNLALFNNLFVNHVDPAGFRAVYVTAQNGFRPRDIRIVHNTVWVANSAGGIRLANADPAFAQLCHANAVFATAPVTGFIDTLGNITDTRAGAAACLADATDDQNRFDLFPTDSTLMGAATTSVFMADCPAALRDFNGTVVDWRWRGAYSGSGQNPGRLFTRDTMPPVAPRSFTAQPAMPPPAGVYCSCGPTTAPGRGSVDPAIAARPFVEGILVRIAWSLLEPTDGVYDWSLLDGQVAAARALGTRVSLAVGCGIGIPQWLFTAGAARLVASVPIADTIAVPWDAIFLDRWTRLIALLGSRYADTPEISLVYMTHSTANGYEMQLPFVTTPTLAEAEYADARMIDAWTRVIDAYGAAFPRSYLTCDLHPVNGSDAVADAVYAHARTVLGLRYGPAAWWWSQKNTSVYPAQYALLRDGAQHAPFSAVQMVQSGTTNPSAFGPGGMPAALALAIADRICYWEIWNNDILNPVFDSLLTHATCSGASATDRPVSPATALHLHPMPARDRVTVRSGELLPLTVVLTSLLGETLQHVRIPPGDGSVLDLSGLSPGLYLLQATRDGKRLHTSPLLIAR